jgi:hypothetical protein
MGDVGVGEDRARMKNVGETINESIIRFPLFDLGFNFWPTTFDGKKIPEGDMLYEHSIPKD